MEPRRSFLAKLVAAGAALIGAAMAGLAGAVAMPRATGATRRWRAAASMFDLPPTGPLVATLTERHADGWHGWRSQAPFQGMLVAAAPEMVPPELYEQLDDGGRLVIPIGARGRQMLLRVTRNGEEFQREELLPVSFVPFVEGTET